MPGILAFRRGESEDLICIYNMRETAQVVPLPPGLDPRPLDAPLNSSQPVGGALSLPAFGAYIGVI